MSALPVSACGTMNPALGSTNISGQLSSVYISSTTVGFCTITAGDGSGGRGSVTIVQTQSPAAPPSIVAVLATPTAIPADGASTSTLTATVRDITGTAVAGDPVAFVGRPPMCGGTSPAVGTTNSSGQVTATYTASTTVGFCTITAIEARTNGSGSVTITQTQPPNTITLTANPSSIVGNGTSNSVITATVTVAGGVFVAGDLVTFTFNVPVPASCGTLNPPLANNTDASGHVTITYTASTTVGFCTIRATDASGGSGSVTIIQTT
jgi:adhesin/invasin